MTPKHLQKEDPTVQRHLQSPRPEWELPGKEQDEIELVINIESFNSIWVTI